MRRFTAKVQVTNRVQTSNNGDVTLSLGADYQDGRNQEWAAATPALSISMTVKAGIGQYIAMGDKFTLTFANDTAAEDSAEPAQSDAEPAEDDGEESVPPNAGSAL